MGSSKARLGSEFTKLSKQSQAKTYLVNTWGLAIF